MLEHIRHYYIDEKANAVPILIAAALALLLGALLFFKYGSSALAKGMGTGFLVMTVLLVTAGVSGHVFNSRKIIALAERAGTSDAELRTSELQRMDTVMNVTFRYAFLAFGMLMVAAMAVIILTKNDYWRGMAIALMVLVALAVVFDSFNVRRNREYLELVTAVRV